MLDAIYKDTVAKMDKAIQALEHNLSSLRTGRASIHLLDGVKANVYGTETPLNQVASLSTPDATSIMITPWDKNMLGPIEKAILQANIGLTPNNDGKVVRLNIPALTQETRKDIVKRAHAIAEEQRIAIRNIRRHANEEVKKTEKNKEVSEDDQKKMNEKIQKLTDEHIKKVDAIVGAKEKEVMTV